MMMITITISLRAVNLSSQELRGHIINIIAFCYNNKLLQILKKWEEMRKIGFIWQTLSKECVLGSEEAWSLDSGHWKINYSSIRTIGNQGESRKMWGKNWEKKKSAQKHVVNPNPFLV